MPMLNSRGPSSLIIHVPMANFEPPSFSLGLDFTVDLDPLVTPMEQPLHVPARPFTPVTSAIDDEVDFGSLATEVSRPFKRLRRGIACERDSTADKWPFELGSNLDDDIEEFSSQEDPSTVAKKPLSQNKSVCSSSKAHLHGQGIFRRVAPQLTLRKVKQSLETPASTVTENASTTKPQFPKLTISPLRRFQLISDSDSDSDDTSISYECRRNGNLSSKSVDKQRTAKSFGINSQKDLWKDFQSEKSFAIPTPALDEVCEEYFRSVQDNTETNSAKGDNRTKGKKSLYGNPCSVDIDESNGCLLDQAPPSHRYFMSDDPRICSLVRTRLPNFFPLDNITNRGNTQPDSSVINYMSQFNQGESSKGKGAVKANDQSNSTKKKKNSKKVTAEETPQGSTSWINPRSSTAAAPENVAKRRVQAVGQSAGHWYTDSSGRRVYVNKSGQELTGKIAYVQYKKDNGTGFKKSKKKKSEGKKKQVTSRRK